MSLGEMNSLSVLTVLTAILQYIRAIVLNLRCCVEQLRVKQKNKKWNSFQNPPNAFPSEASKCLFIYLPNPGISLITDADEGKKIEEHLRDKCEKEWDVQALN